jgi:beta-phosphoglucomutase-like phosphatase (HAD superfamily)
MTERAIVFDCDGVLVDSEGLAWLAWREVLAVHGYRPSDDEIRTLLGRSADEIHNYFASRVKISDEAEMKSALESTMMRLFDEHLKGFEDAVSLAIEGRTRGLRIAVASSSDHRRVVRSLDIVGISELFDVIVAGDDVQNGKPSPDVYVEAARQLGIAPRNCLAVEDSRVGVSAALAAGMFVVAVLRSKADRDDLRSASLVVDRLTFDVLDIAFMADAPRSPPFTPVT